MSKKIKNTLKRGLTLSLAGGTAVTGVAAATGTSVVTTYAETLSNLKQVSVMAGIHLQVYRMSHMCLI